VLSATEQRAAFAARELSPVELIDDAAGHAELGAFVTLTLETAREQAKAAERAYKDGTARPLEGLTLAVKDLFDTAGVTTTYGSRLFATHVPERDAGAVARAKAAGAIVVGKTLTHEFAWGITSVNPHFAPCRNPYDPTRVPGGSSGGSAVALATGGAALALGTDTGGSIRIPAAFCGVTGLKPTFGRVPTDGVFPLAASLDHAGPMARTPQDARLLLEALTGDPVPHAEPATRVAVCPDLHRVPLAPALQAHFDAAARALDASPVGFAEDAAAIHPAYIAIQRAEAAIAHRGLFPARREEYSADVAARIDAARAVTLAEYAEATVVRERVRAAFARLFEDADLLLMPVTSVPPEPRATPGPTFRDVVMPFTVAQNLAGLPSCAVPVGFDDEGLPVGVQLTGPPSSEALVLATAERLFSATASARAGSAWTP
jgi:aspartyl-tRNA(Asn)/glutamyl-tRNA(Gln) amidotransferase subunit A